MSSHEAPMTVISPKRLSNSACTHCRLRKKRCSRELRKCSNCAPWPGPCVYTSSRRDQDKSSAVSARKGSRKAARDSTRLSPRMSSQSAQGLQPISPARPAEQEIISRHPGLPSTNSNSGSGDGTVSSRAEDAECYISPAHSFAVAQGTIWPLSEMKVESNGSATDESSINALMDSLMAAFAKVEVEKVDKSASQDTEKLFYIPQPGTVDALARSAYEVLNLGRLLFSVPHIKDVRDVLLHPSHTEHKGHVLLVNHVLHTLSAASDPDSNTSRAFRSNVQSALNGSSLFLRPCEEHMQALFMLSTHGEGDFAYPNLSWMLVGQACTQAKAIGLHEARASRRSTYGERQRRLTMFWSLFAVDKSVSLAFGRPEFLEATCYQNVPLPDGEYLNQFRPHAQNLQDSARAQTSEYGKCFFLCSIAMSKFISRYSRIVKGLEQVGTYAHDFESWFKDALEGLEAESRRDESCAEWEMGEMMLGIQTLKFQYLHLRCLMFKNVVLDHRECLETSRQALGLLPSLTSSSSSVYNGVVWQLLYYPFTPFFLVFQHMRSNETNPQWESDLRLLESTHHYYVNMSERLAPLRKVTQKLSKTAGAFHSLAKRVATPHPEQQTVVIPDSAFNRLMELYPSIMQPEVDTFNSVGHWGDGNDGLGLPSAGIQWPPDMPSFGDMDWFLWESQELVLPL